MIDDNEIRLYFGRRLREVRLLREEAEQVEAEIARVLYGAGTLDPVRLDAWIDKRRTILAHVDAELLVLAAAPIGSPRWLRWCWRAWRWLRTH
jgi:hypothetical protein